MEDNVSRSETTAASEDESSSQTKGKKKGKKNEKAQANKKDDFSQLLRNHVENIQLKVLDEKQEQSPDAKWAKSLFDSSLYHALPSMANRKVVKRLDFK